MRLADMQSNVTVSVRLKAAVSRLTGHQPGGHLTGGHLTGEGTNGPGEGALSVVGPADGPARPGDRASGHGAAGAAAWLVDVLAAAEVLAPLAERCGSDLERFLTEITLGAEADALDPRADAVPLLTLHAAKGLEFDVVFVAGCERGLLPLWLPGGGGPDPAEERRLLFVGMTRARTHLFLTCARHRRRYGTVGEAGPSPFLTAIDSALLDRSVTHPRRPAPQQLRLL
jgi:UvrD-like helicase C-terminal domain